MYELDSRLRLTTKISDWVSTDSWLGFVRSGVCGWSSRLGGDCYSNGSRFTACLHVWVAAEFVFTSYLSSQLGCTTRTEVHGCEWRRKWWQTVDLSKDLYSRDLGGSDSGGEVWALRRWRQSGAGTEKTDGRDWFLGRDWFERRASGLGRGRDGFTAEMFTAEIHFTVEMSRQRWAVAAIQ